MLHISAHTENNLQISVTLVGFRKCKRIWLRARVWSFRRDFSGVRY